MELLNKLLGFRWSLYVVHNGSLVFAMHEDSALRMVSYVMSYFADGKMPVPPWELYLNFNHKHQTIKILPAHFTIDVKDFTPLLIHQIEAIDPGWNVKGGEPVFEEAATKKKLKISGAPKSGSAEELQSMLDNIEKPKELTFFFIMDIVFGNR
jgi:hypothetical protein